MVRAIAVRIGRDATALALAMLVAVFPLALAAAPVGGVACVWNGSVGNWSDPSGWSNCSSGSGTPIGTPGSLDSAEIGAGTVTLDVLVAVDTLILTGGTVNGANDILVGASLNWTGGRLAAPSPGQVLSLQSAATATLAGGQKTLDGRSFVINGVANWSTGLIELANAAKLQINPTGTLNSNPGAASEEIFESGSDGAQVINNGQIVKSGPNVSGIGVGVIYVGSGSISANQGRLRVYSDGNFDGAYTAITGDLEFSRNPRVFGPASSFASGSNLFFGDASLTAPVNVVQSCMPVGLNIVIADSALQLDCLSPTALAKLRMDRALASVTGPSPIVVTTHFDWGAGTLLGSAGQTFELAVGATATFAAPDGLGSHRYLWSRDFTNHGTITWTGYNDTVLQDGSGFDNASDGTVIVNLIGPPPGPTPDWVVVNSGSMVNHGLYHVVSANAHFVSAPFSNPGTFRVSSGTVYLTEGGSDSGSYDLAGASADVRMQGAAQVRTISGSIGGIGGLSVMFGAQVQALGTLSIAKLKVSDGATLAVDTSATATVGTLFLQAGGILSGAQAVDVQNRLSWADGALSGSGGAPGALRLLPGSNSDFYGAGAHTLAGRKLRVDGAVLVSDGEILVPTSNAGRIEIGSSGQLDFNAPTGTLGYRCGGSPCTAELQSFGHIRQLGATQPSLILTGPLLMDGGTLQLIGGDLSLNALTQSAGIVDVAAGTQLLAGSYALNGGELRGAGSIQADVTNSGGTVRPGNSPGALAIYGDYTQGAGGALVMEVAGVVPGTDLDHLFSNANVSLDGTLTVVDAGYTPVPPQALNLVFADLSLSGSFAIANVPYPGYVIKYTANGVDLVPTGPLAIVVNTRVDPGSGTCDLAECSLREAIDQANSTPGPNLIEFSIPSPQCVGPAGSCVIQPATPLPTIVDELIIDGYTQPGASANSHAPGLGLGSDAVIKVAIDGSAIGSAPCLTLSVPGGFSVLAGLAIHDCQSPLLTTGPAGGGANYALLGNYFGLRADGAASVAGSFRAHGGNVVIGDASAAGMNVFGGLNALEIDNPGDELRSVSIRGNLIGTAPDGVAARPQQYGVQIAASTSQVAFQIGGISPDQRNVISGNVLDGVSLQCAPSSSNCFDGSQLVGNYIGIAADGSPLGNGRDGVAVVQMANGRVHIGNMTPGSGNRIANNLRNGIRATHGGVGRASFLRNEIYANGATAIDLAADGRTANDAGDVDTGPNGLQNFPDFSGYTLAPTGDSAVLNFSIDTSDSGSNYPMTVDFYQAIEDEPGVYLGSASCALSACSANLSFPPTVVLTPADTVLAVVTDNNGKSSEASFYVSTTTISSDAPDPSTVGTPYTVTVDVSSSAPFVPVGAVAIADGAGGNCAFALTASGASTASGSCQLPSNAPAGLRTLTAAYPNGATVPFVASSGNATHSVNAAGPLPTVTTITAVAPEPSVVGEAYGVDVSVTESGAPVSGGSVTVRQLNDNGSCTIVLGPPPRPLGTCQLTGSSALTTALRASYSGTPIYAASASPIVPHLVNRADTAVAVASSAPNPSLAGDPITVAIAVPVVAPGAGVPTGQILITDGSASCGIVLPNTSCVMVPKALGAITLQARYDGDANFNGSTATASHTVTADGADLAILNRNQRRMVAAGQPSSFTVTVSNLGPQNVVNARVVDVLPAQFGNVSWTCAATAGASCPASGSGLIDTLVSLNAGTSVVFTLTATAQLTPEQIVTTTATVTAPVNASDPNLSNNSSSDSDPIGVFGDGLETEDE